MGRRPKISEILERLRKEAMPSLPDEGVFGSYWIVPDNDNTVGDCALRFSEKPRRPMIVIDPNPDNEVWVAPTTTKDMKGKICIIPCPPGSWRTHNRLSYILFYKRIKVKRRCFKEGDYQGQGECQNENILSRLREKWEQKID